MQAHYWIYIYIYTGGTSRFSVYTTLLDKRFDRSDLNRRRCSATLVFFTFACALCITNGASLKASFCAPSRKEIHFHFYKLHTNTRTTPTQLGFLLGLTEQVIYVLVYIIYIYYISLPRRCIYVLCIRISVVISRLSVVAHLHRYAYATQRNVPFAIAILVNVVG